MDRLRWLNYEISAVLYDRNPTKMWSDSRFGFRACRTCYPAETITPQRSNCGARARQKFRNWWLFTPLPLTLLLSSRRKLASRENKVRSARYLPRSRVFRKCLWSHACGASDFTTRDATGKSFFDWVISHFTLSWSTNETANLVLVAKNRVISAKASSTSQETAFSFER